jgi:gentisate 1,2-dioxygenase
VKEPKDLIRKFLGGDLSRREFVERAANGGLALTATATALKGQRIQDAAKRLRNPDQTNLNPYEEWLKQEDLPVYREYGITDLRAIEVKPWKRMGTMGAYLDLKGGEGVNNAYVCEIAPGGSTKPQRYLFEEVLYILSGEGESAIWNPGGAKQMVKWKAGGILGPPLNAWRQHFNRGSTPVRLLAITNAPVVIDLFHNMDFVFNNDYVFRDRYDGDAGEFGAGEDKLHQKKTTEETSEQKGGVYTWESDFIPNARTMGLAVSRERGAGNSRIELQLANNTMQAHISEFEVGTYKKAHRHGPGSHVVMLNGRGYTLMWKGSLKYSEAPQKERVDFVEGSIFVPPDGWFHQHFNSGADPARYLAATWGGDGKWFMRALGGGGRTHRLGKTTTRKGGNLIEYEDEDPSIREIFAAELAKSGIPMKMPGKGKKS